MSDNFKQTVNLRDEWKRRATNAAHPNENKSEREREKARAAVEAAPKTKKPAPTKVKPKAAVKRPVQPERVPKKPDREKARAIDHVYNDDDIETNPELQTIKFPTASRERTSPNMSKALWIVAAIILIAVGYYQFFYRTRAYSTAEHTPSGTGWYSVKLLNDEVYYGQIEDTSGDPVIIRNVYYNYDQLQGEEDKVNESGNLRLVKRGKETHGPDGTLSVVRSQVVYMEPLKEDSKVLKAILEYEK